jgi:hypothetical protein
MTTIHFENQINTHLTLRTLWIQRQHRAQILHQIDREVANNPWNRNSNNSWSVLNCQVSNSRITLGQIKNTLNLIYTSTLFHAYKRIQHLTNFTLLIS